MNGSVEFIAAGRATRARWFSSGRSALMVSTQEKSQARTARKLTKNLNIPNKISKKEKI
jgi:hypothetical protein